MTPDDQPDTITYIHDQSESFMSKMVKPILSLMRMKPRLEKHMRSGKFDQSPAAVPRSLQTQFRMDVSELDGRQIWRFRPKEKISEKVIFYLHGGAYVYNLTKQYFQMVEQLLAKTGATIVVPDYPLAPQAQYEDVFAFIGGVYDQLLSDTDSKNITFLGDSAGGGLALAFAQSLRDDNKPLPQQLIIISPWLDITMSNPDILAFQDKDRILGIQGLQAAGKAYAGQIDPKDYKVSPIYGDLKGLPPVSLFIGTNDLFLPDSRKLKEMMRSADLPINYFEYPDMVHAWVIIKDLPETKQAYQQMADLITN